MTIFLFFLMYLPVAKLKKKEPVGAYGEALRRDVNKHSHEAHILKIYPQMITDATNIKRSRTWPHGRRERFAIKNAPVAAHRRHNHC